MARDPGPGGGGARPRGACAIRLTIVLAVALGWGTSSRGEHGGWEFQPYRIQAVLLLDLPGGVGERARTQLVEYLCRRVDATLAPAWAFELKLAESRDRAAVRRYLGSTEPTEKPAAMVDQHDKLLLLAVRATATGFELRAREYDAYLDRWGRPLARECRQGSALAEQLFSLTWQTFSPVARLEVDSKDPKQVKLLPRGSALPNGLEPAVWARPGDVFAPVLRRTLRNGQVAPNGITQIPWTYLEAVAEKDKPLAFRVMSGNRQPLAGRKQGRIEQLAIALRADPAATTLYFHSRRNKEKPLVGYEVLEQRLAGETAPRVGISDPAGEVAVMPGGSRVEMLLVKHGGQLLARVPVVPGAQRRIEVPLPDDDARLTAESKLAAVREDLIDLVARRNILIARTKQKIEKKDYAAAQQLLRKLDDLPGWSQFDSGLASSSRLIRSDDPQVQRRIEKLFKATQALGAKYLDMTPINDLHNELRGAQRGN
ncbi:MAG: hypothetical protein IT425_13250 [Pirellulales bacterium]|nr:hypothetical protein [Pirellulales bacterium]